MKILSIVGARPQFVKLKPVHDVLKSRNIEHIIIHTGQHYDSNMSEIFFQELELPSPDFNLSVGSKKHGEQIGQMIIGIEEKILKTNPDFALVYGDTNSTLAGAIASVKAKIPTGHIEAGLRSYNLKMPEEVNRIATDHISTINFSPTENSLSNLTKEGLEERSYLVGDVMYDLIKNFFQNEKKIDNELKKLEHKDYFVFTLHRESNTDNYDRFYNIIKSVEALKSKVYLVAHPRLTDFLLKLKEKTILKSIEVIKPLSWVQMIKLLSKSRGLITDSGGLQKESYLLGIPCVTLRAETEWPETLVGGMNVLDFNFEKIMNLRSSKFQIPIDNPFGDGTAASKIVDIVMRIVKDK